MLCCHCYFPGLMAEMTAVVGEGGGCAMMCCHCYIPGFPGRDDSSTRDEENGRDKRVMFMMMMLIEGAGVTLMIALWT